jgi:hypothetical protein
MINKYTKVWSEVFLTFGIISNSYSQDKFDDKFKAVPPKTTFKKLQ